MKKAALLTLTLSGVLCWGAAGQDLPRVGIADFNGFWLTERGQVNVGPALTAMLISEFDGTGGIELLERAQLDALLDEHELQLSGRVTEGGAVEIGRLIGVQYFFFGAILVTADRYRLDIRAVDVETGKVVHALKHLNRPIEHLFTDVASTAERFLAELDLVPPSQRPEAEQLPAGATIAFSEGTTLEDRGDVEGAAEAYERALEIAPSHRAAQRALERVRGR